MGPLMINMAFMPLYMWEMWDVTPVTGERTVESRAVFCLSRIRNILCRSDPFNLSYCQGRAGWRKVCQVSRAQQDHSCSWKSRTAWGGNSWKHCQRHNGPEGWVLLTKLTSLGHITSSNTNLDQTSSESRPCINFKISTKHHHFDKT